MTLDSTGLSNVVLLDAGAIEGGGGVGVVDFANAGENLGRARVVLCHQLKAGAGSSSTGAGVNSAALGSGVWT